VFIIVSDHCAGSAGSVQLPVTGYQIPMLIYAPGFITPHKVETMTAQIDIAPTILGLLNFDYTSPFMGQDIFRLTPGSERAFITTYQGLGYLRNGKLVILSPVKQIAEYLPDFKTGDAQKTAITDSLKKQATAFYQVSSAVLAKQVAGK
jgi:phosphoglycerol transferase MdoB-like AlkP superfamily enzyme